MWKRGGTYLLTYLHCFRCPGCAACGFEEHPRCTFCFSSKLSRAHRLPIDRIPSLFLLLQPTLSAKDICRKVARYARNDDFCKEINTMLGWAAPEHHAGSRTGAPTCPVSPESGGVTPHESRGALSESRGRTTVPGASRDGRQNSREISMT